MESRLAEIERLMQDKSLPHSDQQLLDQELDELLRQMDAADELRAMGDFEEPPEEEPNPNEGVDDRTDCAMCSGCAYCMVLGDYDPNGEV